MDNDARVNGGENRVVGVARWQVLWLTSGSGVGCALCDREVHAELAACYASSWAAGRQNKSTFSGIQSRTLELEQSLK